MNQPQRRRDFSPDMAEDAKPVLPSALEAEQALLGAVFLNDAAMDNIPTILDEQHFEEPLHGQIFREMKRLRADGKGINPVTIKMAITNPPAKIGGKTFPQYLVALATEAVSVINVPDFAAAILDAHQRREIIGLAQRLHESAFKHELEIPDDIKAIEDRLAEVRSERVGGDGDDDEKVVDDYLRMITGSGDENGADGIPLPFPDFEYLINDTMLRPGRTYGILAASAEGKTSLTLQVSYAALIAGHPVCILSYDQDQMEILAQMTAQQEGIPFSSQLQNSRNHQRLTQQQIDAGYGFVRKLKRMPFEVIQCRTSDTVPRLEAKMDGFLRRRANGRMPLFVFDHIRAIKASVQGDEGTKAMQIGQDIHDAMKARRSAGWVLQQRSTSGLKRENPRPASVDLYGGDAAKQPFDVIFYAFRATEHRDEQIKTAKDEADAEKIRSRFSKIYGKDRNDEYFEIEGHVEIGMIKNRFGNKNRRAILKFDAEYTRFSSRRRTEQGSMFG